MDRRVKWTRLALTDLEEIADYISRESPRYASIFVSEARRAARSLARYSFRSRRIPEFGREDIRELLLGSYRLIFQIKKDHVRILTVIHGARDLSGWSDLPSE